MGVVERSREVMAVVALHEALRNVCINSDWTYSVFWTIRPRQRLRGGLGCKAGDEGSLMLMWEDGYCRPASCSEINTAEALHHHEGMHRVHSANNLGDDMDDEDPVRKSFRKMSIQLYNYGEGLMGKVASDKCHKWVFRETSETESGPMNYWQSSFDSHPPEWIDQFSAGIQTIAVIQAGHGLLQLGSCKIVAEDLHFVLRMRYTFESLENQSGGFLSQQFAPMRNRFFCGSPTSSPTSSAWQNAQPSSFVQNSSDFRLRLGMTNESMNQEYMQQQQQQHQHQHQHPHQRLGANDDNITSLRLSLQNAASSGAAAAGPLSYEFRNSDQEVDPNQEFATAGMKRPAATAAATAAAAATQRTSLLARRLHQHSIDNSFHLLDNSNHQSNNFSSPVLLIPNSPSSSSSRLSNLEALMVQIPPSSSSASPMPSPGITISNSNGLISPIIQTALDSIDRLPTALPRSGHTSPLAIRLSQLTEQVTAATQYLSNSRPATPKPSSHGSRPTTPVPPPPPSSSSSPVNHFLSNPHHPDHTHPGTPKTITEMHFLTPGIPHNNKAISSADSNSTAVHHHYLNNGASNTITHDNHHPDEDGNARNPPAAWENQNLSNNRSADMYTDFMESFFE